MKRKGVYCTKHPTYKAIHKPKCDCPACLVVWNMKQQKKQEEINE